MIILVLPTRACAGCVKKNVITSIQHPPPPLHPSCDPPKINLHTA
jgi:hypothetical protein